MTIETKVIINFTDDERVTLKKAATILLDCACETEGISDEMSEISERFDKAYELIRNLLNLEGQKITPQKIKIFKNLLTNVFRCVII